MKKSFLSTIAPWPELDIPKGKSFTMYSRHINDLLVIDFYAGLAHQYLIFLSKDDFITKNLITGKWMESMIMNLGAIRYDCWENGFYFDQTAEHIEDFTGQPSDNPFNMIADYQQSIRERQLQERHDKEKQEIDEVMSLIPTIPNDFESWIDQEVFKNKRFAYYDYAPTKTVEAFCDYCGSSFITKRPKHQVEGICPSCQSQVTFLVSGRTSQFKSDANVFLLQNTSLGLVLRVFHVIRNHYLMRQSRQNKPFEEHRLLLEVDPVRSFSFEYFKNTSEIRWCNSTLKSEEGAFYTGGFLYGPNLPDVLSHTKYKYSGIEYMAKLGPFSPTRYLRFYNENKLVELLAKAGLSNLINEMTIRAEHKTLGDITGITNPYYLDMVMASNPNRDMIYCMASLQNDKRRHTLDDVIMYASQPVPFLDAQLRKKEHPRKLYKYLTSQKIKSTNRWFAPESASGYFNDYTRMREELGDLLIADEGKYPQYLKAAHDRLVKRYNECREELDRRSDAKIDDDLQKVARKHQQKLKFEDGVYTLVLASSVNELKDEGEALHHCVGSYAKRMAKESSLVAFVRKKDDPETPLTTIEIDPRRHLIIQARAKYNKDPDRTVKAFLESFAHAKQLDWRDA